MADIEQQLREIALQLAESAEAEASRLQSEYVEAEKQLAEKKAALEALRSRRERWLQFRPIIAETPQCPICWDQDRAQANLIPDESPPGSDLYHCSRRRHHEFSFES